MCAFLQTNVLIILQPLRQVACEIIAGQYPSITHHQGYNVGPISLHICTHISFYSHLHSPMSRFTLTAHVNHLILGVPVTHLLPSNHQKPKPSGSISICHYLPLQVWNTSQTQPVNRAVRRSSPLLRSNCRCNTQICPTLPDSCEAHPPHHHHHKAIPIPYSRWVFTCPTPQRANKLI